MAKHQLLQLRSDGFEIEDARDRNRFAIELLTCLGSPDPVLRDQVAYEGYASLLRENRLRTDTIERLRVALVDMLEDARHDENGFRQPFAALILSEVARTDRINPVFSDDAREALVSAATAYMKSITDYRGFSETEGWRHAVAHTADLLLQLALNPALSQRQLLRLLDAVSSQVRPSAGHFYIYGESDRLARPIFAIAQRGLLAREVWTDWFAELSSPRSVENWSIAYANQQGLAELHNVRAFARAVYLGAITDESIAFEPLREGSLVVLQALP